MSSAASTTPQLLLESSLAGIYRTTIGGEFVECNGAFARMLGYRSPRDLASRNASELYFSKADRQRFMRRLRREGRLVNFELRLRRKDGTPIDILENVHLLHDERGRPRFVAGTTIDITERRRMEAALRESEARHRRTAEELQRLAQHLQSVREEERARIARELHDDLGQVLTALSLDLHWLKGRLRGAEPAIRARLDSMSTVLAGAMLSLRGICTELRPAMLDHLGLIETIEWQVGDFRSKSRIRCDVSLPKRPVDLPRDRATALFRVLQECLTNVIRHARASRVQVSLSITPRTVHLEVVDDGVGVKPSQLEGPGAMGVAGMRERAARFGGSVSIGPVPGRGTRVAVSLPRGEAAKAP